MKYLLIITARFFLGKIASSVDTFANESAAI